ncbi:hypothetical protein D6D29_03448 [Aureobasidium pullulans]|nr:hypothetical protein D6D29_03448 [Aureobasidium pullulans]
MSQMLQPSRVAQQIGYRRPNRLERAKAAGLIDVSLFEDADYPAPLVLPNDEIDFHPDYPPQSLSDWQKHITPKSLPIKRTKIYLVPPPGWTEKASFSYRNEWPHRHLLPPSSESIVEYLAAFYHGFEVLQLPKETLTFDEWIEEGLNLNDLLDAAITVLPNDALTLILHIDLNLYKDDDDDFVYSRAYSKSYVCVVSSFRYSPRSDKDNELDYKHFWLANHYATYVKD